VRVSRRWLEYAFRDEFGDTPYQYIRKRRLEQAARLLRNEPTFKVYQVAQRTGFSSAKQLTMAFRQHYGVSPREYRRAVANDRKEIAKENQDENLTSEASRNVC